MRCKFLDGEARFYFGRWWSKLRALARIILRSELMSVKTFHLVGNILKLSAANQNTGEKHQKTANSNLECRLKEGGIHIFVTDP